MGDSLSEHRPPSGSFPEMPQSTPEMILDTSNSETDEARSAIRLNVPQRYLVVPSVCALTGLSIGLMRGSREEGLRFLAENAHRAPTTVKGWYLYKKTKNYRMLWGGMKSGGKQALRLGVIGMTWAGLEDGMERVGAGEVKEVGAGLGTSILFSALCECAVLYDNVVRRKFNDATGCMQTDCLW